MTAENSQDFEFISRSVKEVSTVTLVATVLRLITVILRIITVIINNSNLPADSVEPAAAL